MVKSFDWNYAGEHVHESLDPMGRLLDMADNFFDGKLLIIRDRGVWFVMLGVPPLTESGTMEVLEGPCGPTFMEAVEEALKRAAPLSEEG